MKTNHQEMAIRRVVISLMLDSNSSNNVSYTIANVPRPLNLSTAK